jgi:hypothetical protein
MKRFHALSFCLFLIYCQVLTVEGQPGTLSFPNHSRTRSLEEMPIMVPQMITECCFENQQRQIGPSNFVGSVFSQNRFTSGKHNRSEILAKQTLTRFSFAGNVESQKSETQMPFEIPYKAHIREMH